jgi:hypothetical protein
VSSSSAPAVYSTGGRSSEADRPLVRLALLVATVAAASGAVGWVYWVLSARVRAGTDYAARLSVLRPYVGVDATYVLARAFGITALVFAAASVAVGLEVGRRRLEQLPVSASVGDVHRYVSLTVLALVAAHATVPFLSVVPPYGGWATALVPLAQPFSWGAPATVFESLGILAFYLLVVVGPSCFVLRRRLGAWAHVHRLAVVAYVLAVLHTLFLGSDFSVAGPARVALVAAQVPVALVLARRLRVPAWRVRYPVLSLTGTGVALGVAAACGVLAGLMATGGALAGFHL